MAKKTNAQAVSNEEIIAALIQHGTVREAAEAVGIAPRTIYDRMHDSSFRSQYLESRAEILREAVFSFNAQLAAAIETVAEIMTDNTNNPAVRLQAAQTILNNAEKLTGRLDRDERTSRNESINPFNF